MSGSVVDANTSGYQEMVRSLSVVQSVRVHIGIGRRNTSYNSESHYRTLFYDFIVEERRSAIKPKHGTR